MPSQRHDLMLGAAAVGFVGLLITTILLINPLTAKATREIVVEFSHDAGVAPVKDGSRVLLAGALDVGKVTNVSMRSDATSGELLISVRAAVDRELKLYRDCRIATTQPPVGGGGVLVIVNVGTQAAGEIGGQVVRGTPPESLTAAISELSRRVLGPGGMVEKLDRMIDDQVEGSLAFKIQASMDDVNALTRQILQQASPDDQLSLLFKLHRAFDDVNQMTAALRQQMNTDDSGAMLAKVHLAIDTLNAALADAKGLLADNRPTIRSAVDDIAGMTSALRSDALPALQAELRRDDGAALLGKVHAGLDKLNAALADVNAITDSGRRLVLVNRPAIDRTIMNLKETSTELRTGIQTLILNPWRLLNKPSADEQAKLDAFEAARRFAEAATYLDDASARLEALAAAGGGAIPQNDAELGEVRATLKLAFERFQAAETFLWEKMK